MKQRIKTLFAGGVLALALFNSAMAGPQEDGLAAYQRGDYATAMRLLRPFAEKGNAVAQFDLGVMYASNGQGVQQDNAEAVKWYSATSAHNSVSGSCTSSALTHGGQEPPFPSRQASAVTAAK